MKHVRAVNKCYSDLYKNLGKFAFAPYSWGVGNGRNDEITWLFRLFFEIPLKLVLTPILLPATAITFALAALSALLAALTQPFALIGAAIADAVKPHAPVFA